ncbi:bile acid:sodium symporter family protein [Micrococcales bacterium 31B]|nr:bile acid:sodium symporter family protein [Micrococcales bacterium 31B]
METLHKLSSFVGKTFALWVIVFGVLGFVAPSTFTPLAPYISILLGVVMFGMGMTMTLDDFKNVVRYPKGVIIGVVAHYLIMPGLAWLLTQIFQLDPYLSLGVILVGCCPSGTASNVMAFLAKGNTPLAVGIGTVSTLLAPILTPVLILVLASRSLHVDVASMFLDVVKVVLVPIVLGLLVNLFAKRAARAAVSAMPLVSALAIVLIVAAVVGGSKEKILTSGALVFVVVILHNLGGYGLGYGAARLLRLDHRDAIAVTFEVGMQNSGLGAALAGLHFKANPEAALPSALFSFWHNLSGPALATFFAGRDRRTPEQILREASLR